MLVVMMTEVLCRRPGLVLAIAGHRCPGELERQKNVFTFQGLPDNPALDACGNKRAA